MKEFDIEMIKELTFEDAKELAIESMEIKEHECFFVDFGGCFGYSVLVFKNRKHVYYADDFELHHTYKVKESGKEALKQWYIKSLNRKLFTDIELMETVINYDEYERKNYFLRNYYIMRFDYISIFGIGEEAKKAFEEARNIYTVYNPVSFCYVKDKTIVDTQTKILKHLEKSFKNLKKNDETFRQMISSELANHEACITCDYTDALDSLGLNFNKLTESQQKIVKEELRRQINAYY
ncbi:DUF7659 family protein [Mediterraneibacter gnavus]|uniref:DUF7659 family protein n=1 Tax=Mediterraneibacter gnavus TaxID=33038 RepID=UPI000465A8F4|nr:hypothetical protein [Mediterraneibacter gnavus]